MAETLKPGDAAPTFELPSSDGGTVASNALIGRGYVLYFYPRADTPGCTKEACGFRDAIADYKKLGVEVFGVSPDSCSDVTAFAKKFDLNFSLLADADHTVCEAFGVWREKVRDGKTSWGAARTTFVIGRGGEILRVYENVQPDGHDKEVLADLQSEGL